MIYQSDGVRIDTRAFRVEREGEPRALEPKAFDLLVCLVRHAGEVVTKTQILDEVWAGTAVTDNALTRVIAQLRRALGDDPREARFIETVPTRGYRWLPPVIEQAEVAHPAAAATVVGAHDGMSPGRPAAVEEPDVAASRAAAPASRRPLIVALVAVALAAGGAAAWFALHRRPAERVHVATAFPVQLTTERSLDLFPSPSPDGKAMIYASDRSGWFELYVRPLVGGGTETALTRDGGQNVQPAWSPDGRLVAFHSMARGGIWVMPALGGVARQVSTFGSDPAWSPDSRTVAFQSDPLGDLGPAALGARPGSTIWVIDPDGASAPRALTQPNRPPGGHASPAWTGDGRRVFFANHAIASTEWWSVAADGTGLISLGTVRSMVYDPVFTADGEHLLVSTGGSALVSVPVSPRTGAGTGMATLVGMPAVDGLRFAAPAGGGRVLFSGLVLESQLIALPIDPATGDTAGSPRAITNSSARRTSAPVISPDGRWVAYVSGARGAAADVFTMRLDGSGLQQVTTAPEADMRPSWFPDSDGLAFVSSRNGRRGIWKTSRSHRRESLLAEWAGAAPTNGTPPAGLPRSVAQDPRMSPDGTAFAYSAVNPASGRAELHVQAFATRADRVIASGPEGASFPCWSPDGRLIAFELKRAGSSQVAVVPADGGDIRVLTDTPGEHWVHSFSPDGSKVLSADLDDGVWNIAWTAVADGRRRVLTTYASPRTFVRYPTWSPAGDVIVFEEARLHSNIWTAELK